MKRSHILEERRKLVNPDIRKSVTEVFDRIDAFSSLNRFLDLRHVAARDGE